ncbi:hypothetical protein [Candidiatus Paracoxiella cheracis]|uniref:hypothetical protein n=1 Tax=Candidiatus Paracoxiella cheracis TaxID=3405120 RepID=UPI003BF5F6B2
MNFTDLILNPGFPVLNTPSSMNKEHFFRLDFQTIVLEKLKDNQSVSIEEMSDMFGTNLNRHIGSNSTFKSKKQLTEYLMVIYNRLKSDNISGDEKIAIKNKILEAAEACSPGFMNSIQDLITGFVTPKTVSALLYCYRIDLLNKARSATPDVHSYEKYYTIANTIGLKVRSSLAIEDIYRGDVSNDQIEKNIILSFNMGYTPYKIVENLFISSFAERGYLGRKNEGYEIEVYEKILNFFKEAICRPTLSYNDCFVIDEKSWSIIDIDWTKIISFLIEYFEREKYFHFKKEDQVCVGQAEDLALQIDKKDLRQTRLVVKGLTIFLGNIRHLDKDRINVSCLSRLVNSAKIEEEQKHYILSIFYLNGFDILIRKESLKNTLQGFISNRHSLNKFRAMIQVLDVTRIAAVCEAMQDSLSTIIVDGYQFGYLLKPLSAHQCLTVCERLKSKLMPIIQNGEGFKAILLDLDTTQRTSVCEALKDRLAIINWNTHNFKSMLETIDTSQRTVVCEALKGKLPKIIRDGHELGAILQMLDNAQRTAVCETMKDRLSIIIQDGSSLNTVLEVLDTSQRTVVYEALKDKFPEIMRDGHELGAILQMLDNAQRTAVCETMKDRLSIIIQDGSSLNTVLEVLDTSQRTVVYEALKDKFPEIMRDGHELGAMLQMLDNAQRTAVCETMKDRLSIIIQDGSSLNTVLEVLDTSQRTVVYEALKDKFPEIMRDGHELGAMLQMLDNAQRTAVCETMKDRLSIIIQDGSSLNTVLEVLDTSQRTVVYEALKDKFPEIMWDRHEFETTVRYFNLTERSKICADLTKKLSGSAQTEKYGSKPIFEGPANFFSSFKGVPNPKKACSWVLSKRFLKM